MSLFKKLFGGGAKSVAPTTDIEHQGYHIVATPMAEGSEFRICGVISKEIDGQIKQYEFIRADMLPSVEAANELTIRKAKQIIAEQGDRMFG